MTSTSYMVLRKTPFQESSLVVAGVSPEYGRLDFMVKGAKSSGPKKFPVIGLFRELSIQFREPKGGSHGLLSMRSCEISESFDAVSNSPEAYIASCEYAAFILRHTHPMLECPATCKSLKVALGRICSGEGHEAWLCLARLAFLHESGFIPESLSLSDDEAAESRRRSLLIKALDCAAGNAPLPEVPEGYWTSLAKWLDSICLQHSLK